MSTVLEKFKKVELIDLADKLGLSVSTSNTKPTLVLKILDHLESLDEPVDLNEYPELQLYYEALAEDNDEEDSEEEESSLDDEEEEDEQDIKEMFDRSDLPTKSPACLWFSNLRFVNKVTNSPYYFRFHEFVDDVQWTTQEWNETVQDYLSTLHTVKQLVLAVELFVFVKSLIQFNWYRFPSPDFVTFYPSQRDFILSVSFWFIFSRMIPSIVSYYFNFVRHELFAIEFDPLVYHLTKVLISLQFLYNSPSVKKEIELLLSSDYSICQLLSHGYNVGLFCWKFQLGHLPLIANSAAVIIALYVLA
ncbi:Gtt3p [Kluyveromyces lactis]|uniref:KLLA0A11396p n=1 Tax=Kluyveromyces lactis (strain ATCC 8585 / CBS 2359 / DSM 70799 / NBRC 1267 / NRRL Y-1140 / WM37) TaxID=284590 RepID=Q6CX44_KLULA|nr:uncharacterized protein KLLA0_A11396g [Kluyveromyces lactis]CAH03083.1 KLLA0A11396p [Kluyveromyces lactis]|eukprot:XP_451495.1 uncharacterized protein KLLA0_A11396g [Kluyveromyces lactis]